MSSDPRGPLPRGWTWVRVGELAANEPNAITDGPFGSNLKTAHYVAAGPRVIRLQNVGDGAFVDAMAHISKDHFERLAKHRVEAGDLVIAALGETLPRSCIIPSSVGPAIVKADCIRLKPDVGLTSAKYLNFALNSESTRTRTAAIVHGVGRPRLNLGEIKSIEVPLAPLTEQGRIVEVIEEQFTRLDAAVAGLKRVRTNLKRYRAAVLKAACEGRLVPTEAELARAEGRDYEPADRLLARILEERRARWEAEQLAKMSAAGKVPKGDGWKAKYEEPIAVDTDIASHLPHGWMVASTDGLTSHITSGSRDWSKYYGRGTATFIMAQNVRPGRLDMTYRQPVDPPINSRDRARTRVNVNDLLVTIVGANTGDVCRVDQEFSDYFVCQSVAIMRPVESRASRFMTLYLSSKDHGQRQYRQYIYGAGRPHLSFEQLRSTAIALPPIAEQERIVTEVDRRLSVVEKLEATVEANLRRAERTRQSILKRAFEGKLVPRDPSDEPASVLLERIRAERAAQEVNGTGRRRKRTAEPSLPLPLTYGIGSPCRDDG